MAFDKLACHLTMCYCFANSSSVFRTQGASLGHGAVYYLLANKIMLYY